MTDVAVKCRANPSLPCMPRDHRAPLSCLWCSRPLDEDALGYNDRETLRIRRERAAMLERIRQPASDPAF